MNKSISPLFLFLILINYSCLNPSNQKKLDSFNIATQEERVELLKKNITSFSNFMNADFELFNVNGFVDSRQTSIPGPSSWDYKFVIKMDSVNISKWIEGFTITPCSTNDFDWTQDLISKRESIWKIDSTPQCYIRAEENVTIIVYPSEGIIFKRVLNL